jgi:hypothetical protein
MRRLSLYITVFGLLLLLKGSAMAAVVTGDLNLWLKADAGVATDGSGNVTSWADQSGNAHDATPPSTSNEPLLVNNALNGNPVIQFSGAGQFLSIAGQVLTSQQFTILAVVNDTRSSGDGSFREVFSNWSGTNTTTSVFLGTAGQSPVRARFTDDMGGANDPLHTQTGVGTISNPSSHFIFTGVSGATDAAIYQNSNQIADNGAPLSLRDLTGTYNIGTQGGFEFWQGDIAELLVYNKELSASELQQDWSYLDQKYGISGVPEPGTLIIWSVLGTGAAVALRRRKGGGRWSEENRQAIHALIENKLLHS